MMGEYIIYYKDVIIGGIYDDRFLIKKTKSNNIYLLKEEIPYEGAKPMWLVDDVDDDEKLIQKVLNVYNDLNKK